MIALGAAAAAFAAFAGMLPLLFGEAPQWEPLRIAADYPEGPVLVGGRLFYAEMTADRVTRIDGREMMRLEVRDGCGPTSVSPFGDGRIVVLCHLSGGLIVMSEDGVVEREVETDAEGARLTYPNDSHGDGQGGVYFSSSGPFAPATQPAGRLFHLRADASVQEVAGNLTYPNGVFTNGDGRLFVSEHLAGRVLLFRIEADGSLSGKTVFADRAALGLGSGGEDALTGPDGIEVARDGRVFVAVYGAARVIVLGADGGLLDEIAAPMPYLTNIVLDEAAGRAYLAGAFDNRTWPYEGQVMEVALP